MWRERRRHSSDSSPDNPRSRSPHPRSRNPTPEPEPRPHPNMDEVIQALRELAAQGIQTTARINALTATVNANVEAQANRPQPLPRLDSTKFAILDIGTGSEASIISKLCAWEAAISFNIVSFDGMRANLPPPRLISAILGSLHDPCWQMTQGMDPTI